MTFRNHVCTDHGDIAWLRADWKLSADDGAVATSGSSADLLRRQGMVVGSVSLTLRQEPVLDLFCLLARRGSSGRRAQACG
jgi:hypothetical protein